MSITFNSEISGTPSERTLRQAYERLGLSIGIPPQIAQKMYKGQGLDNQQICRLYTKEYNTHLASVLPEISTESLDDTALLEKLYNEQETEITSSKIESRLMNAVKTNNFPQFLLTLCLEPKPQKSQLGEALKMAILSLLDESTNEKERMVKALVKQGAELPEKFGHTILNKLAEGEIHRLNLPVFKRIVSMTQEKFLLHHLGNFLEKKYCQSSEDLLNTVAFFLNNLEEYPLQKNPELSMQTGSTSVVQSEAKVQQPADEQAKRATDLIISNIVKNCLKFDESNDLLELLRSANLQGNCCYNTTLLVNAVSQDTTVAVDLAQFFIGRAAQAKLENLLSSNTPSLAALKLLTACGARVNNQFLIHLLEMGRSDEAVDLTLQIMNGIPSENALQAAIREKRLKALDLMIKAGSTPTEDLLSYALFPPEPEGKKSDPELLAILIKGGAPVSDDMLFRVQFRDTATGSNDREVLLKIRESITKQ